MNVLITGASGYLGGHLTSALIARGHRVHGLTIEPVPPVGAGDTAIAWHVYDGSTPSVERAVRDARPEVVIHLAASSRAGSSPEDVVPIVQPALVLGAQVLACAAQARVRRVLAAGSYWEFGERGRAGPNTFYAATKSAFRVMLDHFVARGSFDGATLALFDVYGPRDPRPKLLPRLVRAMTTGETVPLSPGEQRLDMVHVEDVARAFVAAAECEEPLALPGRANPDAAPVFGVCTGRSMTLRTIVDTLERAAGKPVRVHWGASAYPAHQIMQPIDTLPPVPGWAARVRLEDGLASVVQAG